MKLSGRALRILLDEREGSEERERLLQQAALIRRSMPGCGSATGRSSPRPRPCGCR